MAASRPHQELLAVSPSSPDRMVDALWVAKLKEVVMVGREDMPHGQDNDRSHRARGANAGH
jgi:hypothetical protein